MSRADFEKARERLRRAKNDISWALESLRIPQIGLNEYKLKESEQRQLRQALQEDLSEIQTALTQAFPLRATIEVERTIETVTDDFSFRNDTVAEPTQNLDEGTYISKSTTHISTETASGGSIHYERSPDIPKKWPPDEEEDDTVTRDYNTDTSSHNYEEQI